MFLLFLLNFVSSVPLCNQYLQRLFCGLLPIFLCQSMKFLFSLLYLSVFFCLHFFTFSLFYPYLCFLSANLSLLYWFTLNRVLLSAFLSFLSWFTLNCVVFIFIPFCILVFSFFYFLSFICPILSFPNFLRFLPLFNIVLLFNQIDPNFLLTFALR